jgi:uncharacterized ion transporter superfamily protein YfcC
MKILDIILVIMMCIGVLFIISGYKTKFLPDNLDTENFDIFNEQSNENEQSNNEQSNEKNRIGFFNS